MADDFDREYEDDLEALLEMEEEVGSEFEPFNTKSRKSLNFSTPSTKHDKKKKPTNNNENPDGSLLNDSFPTPLPAESPQTGNGRTAALKRRQEEMFGTLSDDSDEEGTLTIDADLPEIVHKRKKPRMNGEVAEPEVDPVDDFQITPPPSPTPLQKAMRHCASRDKVKKGQTENLSEYQDRITQHYDLERERVLRMRPRGEDYVNVTGHEGIRVFMKVKNDVAQTEEIENLGTAQKQLQLLGTPLAVLKAQVEEQKSRRAAEELEQLENIIDRSQMPETEEIVMEEKVPGKSSLWVDRYSPHRYTELLSDEATNRLLLKWLKQWDYVVFGKECKLPKGDQKNEQDKEQNKNMNKNAKGKPFFKKDEPEVLDELDQHKRPLHKVSLLCGPPGLGKTTLAHVIARHAGYNVVEINASDDRSADVFKTKIEAATQMKAVLGQDPRPNCLIIDEIDGAPQPAINMLLSIIKGPEAATGKKKKKKGNLLLRPIICICNDVYTPSLRQLRPIALTVTFPPTVATKLASRLQQVARTEELRADLTVLLALCEKTDNDIRSCLNTLQFVRSKSKELTLSAVNSTSVGQKDAHKSLFTVWKSIFTMPKPKRKRYVNPHDRENLPLQQLEEMSTANQNNLSLSARFQNTLQLSQATGETEKVMQGLYENYLLAKVKDPRMNMVQLANAWMCCVDLMNKEVMATQNYILMRYTQYLPVAFHLMFASNHHPRIQYPHSQYENQTKLNKAQGLMEAMLNDMAPSVRKTVNLETVVMEMLPPLLDIIQPNLRPINTQLYSQREKAELAQLIRIMIAYNMTYHQERTMDGQYVYNLDPRVDDVARLPGVKQHKQLTYATKQLISREIELEKMRRTESKRQGLEEPVAPPAESKKNQADVSEKKVVPNHLRQTLQPKAVKASEDEHEVDFFGRKVKVDAERPGSKSDVTREVIGGDIWFRFKEGFTNAVRRTVRVSDLL